MEIKLKDVVSKKEMNVIKLLILLKVDYLRILILFLMISLIYINIKHNFYYLNQ